ncbi:MAG TPA: DUF4932 domain-containing protein [Flavisolibacter sp.]|nr:DUF4932 domain-containing protein [Flavisolibacter sp.]
MNPWKSVTLLLLLGGHTAYAQTSLPVIQSNVKEIEYTIDGKKGSWNIVPEAKPDILEVPVGVKQKSRVTFKTDVDSVTYTVKLDQKINFIVLLKGDSAHTQIAGVPKNVNFSSSYIKKHKGKFDVEIPEVQELAKIMVAISKVGSTDSNMTNMRTPYYQEVKAHFTPFRNHPVIDTINQYIKDQNESSYWHYYGWKMNANAYTFTKEGKIVNKGVIRKMGFTNPADPFIKHADLVADFAKKSGFRQFYTAHKPYYDSSLKTYLKYNPLQEMKAWAELHFPFKYDYYLITYSPLTGGAHSTQGYEDNGFNQTVMYIAGVNINPNYNEAVNEMLNSRVVFTEIDHNYVNPTADKYLKEINEAMKDKNKWGKGLIDNSHYTSPYNLFAEYMTWGVFSLYCLDKFKESDVLTFLDRMEPQMEQRRGFNNFKAFNRELMRLYLQYKKTKKAHELFPEMLEWCKKQ